MADKKKPTGTFYRKRKKDMERENEKQAKAMSKFFVRSEVGSSVESESHKNDTAEQQTMQVRAIIIFICTFKLVS